MTAEKRTAEKTKRDETANDITGPYRINNVGGYLRRKDAQRKCDETANDIPSACSTAEATAPDEPPERVAPRPIPKVRKVGIQIEWAMRPERGKVPKPSLTAKRKNAPPYKTYLGFRVRTRGAHLAEEAAGDSS